MASLQADGGRNATSFTEDMYHAYGQICPLKTTKAERLLILQGPPHAALDLHNLTQSWMPVTHPLFGAWEANGYVILIVVFVLSLAFQVYFGYQACCSDSFFRQPCLERWLEYALTSPLQVVLVACSVMIRDVHTLMLLWVAQAVCVALGYSIECALQSVKWHPPLDWGHTTTSQNLANRLWWMCATASSALHVFVWYILITQLSSLDREVECHGGPHAWREPLRAVVYGQFALFMLFAVVPFVQKLLVVGGAPAAEVFMQGSIAYAVLSVAAKITLGVSYICFVRLFQLVNTL